MPTKITRNPLQWKCSFYGATIMLALFGITNAYSGEAAYISGVPPITIIPSASSITSHTALNSRLYNPKRNSVVFKKKKQPAGKALDCAKDGSCVTQRKIIRPKRPNQPDDTDVGLGISANNNSQAAKVRAKVPF